MNKSIILLLSVAAASANLFAAPSSVPAANPGASPAVAKPSSAAAPVVTLPSSGKKSQEELKALREQRRIKAMNETGGFIADPREASGRYVFVNVQTSVPEAAIAAAAQKCQTGCLVLTGVVPLKGVTVATADAEFRKLKANLATFLVESDGLPMSLVAFEGRWAMVNVAALKKDSPSPELLALRVAKMMSRSMGLLFQSGYSVSPRSTMQVVDNLHDLDRIPGTSLAPDCQTVIQQTAPKFGFRVMKRVFYRKALEEGWAPAPVTEHQKNCKALWEKERAAAPSKGLKIEFDKTKQDGVIK